MTFNPEDEVYDGYSEDAVEDIKGITDSVTDLSFTNIAYPAIVILETLKLQEHKVKVISGMTQTSAGKKDISLYYQHEGELYKLGALSGMQIMPFFDIVPTEFVKAYYTDGTPLEGAAVYTLYQPLM
jgi:translation initiation factor 2B subunit (eIF-2B alpha/beta/delta family)